MCARSDRYLIRKTREGEKGLLERDNSATHTRSGSRAQKHDFLAGPGLRTRSGPEVAPSIRRGPTAAPAVRFQKGGVRGATVVTAAPRNETLSPGMVSGTDVATPVRVSIDKSNPPNVIA